MLSLGRAESTHFKVCRPASGRVCHNYPAVPYWLESSTYINEWVRLGPATDVNKDLQREVLGRVLFEVTVYCPLVPVPSRQHCFQDISRLHTTAGGL